MNLKKKKQDKKGNNSFWEFLQFTGKKGRKDVIFLCFGYLFLVVLLLLALLFRDNIPVELTYAIIALPFVYFGFALIFWILKRFFSFLYQKMSILPFILVCIFLFLLYNGIITWVIQEKQHQDNDLYFIPLIILFFISSFLICLMIWNMFENIVDRPFKQKLLYIVINVFIFSISYFLIIKKIDIESPINKMLNQSEFLTSYITLSLIHLLFYALLWIAFLLKGGAIFLLINRFPKIKTKKQKKGKHETI